MHTVFRVLLIFTLCLEHEPLEDVIIPRNDAGFFLSSEKAET